MKALIFILLAIVFATGLGAPSIQIPNQAKDSIRLKETAPLVTKEELLAQADVSLDEASVALGKANDALTSTLAGTTIASAVLKIVVQAEADATIVSGEALLEGQNLEVEALAVRLTQALTELGEISEGAIASVLGIVNDAGFDPSPINAITDQLGVDLNTAIAPLRDLIGQVPPPTVVLVTKEELLVQAEASLVGARADIGKFNDALAVTLAGTSAAEKVLRIVVQAESEATIIAGEALIEGSSLRIDLIAARLGEDILRIQDVATKAIQDTFQVVADEGIDNQPLIPIADQLYLDVAASVAPLVELLEQVLPPPAQGY